MTADAAAKGIRELDPEGTIGIISAEPDPPYSRPPLTKALWKGDREESVWRGTDEAGAAMHLATVATAIDPDARLVRTGDDTTYTYGQLLIATGGTPRRLPSAPESVLYFRTLRDYRRLRELTGGNTQFVVLGGGFIGSEIAAALRMNDQHVTMIIPESGVGARVFPADLAGNVTEYYREKGVIVRADTAVSGIQAQNGRLVVSTSGGQAIDADAVVAGLGIVPNVELAEQAGLAIDNGIVVDDRLRTSDPGIFAAGDVASFYSDALGRRIRVEHEDNAVTMGKAAGRSMAGEETPYRHLPFFYSDLFDLGYEAVGILDSRLQTVADWKEPFRKGVIYYLEEGRVRGVLLWNTWGQVDAARALIAESGPFEAASLKGRIEEEPH